MEYQEYLDIKQEMYENFMILIDDENDIEEDSEDFINLIEKAKCQKTATEFDKMSLNNWIFYIKCYR